MPSQDTLIESADNTVSCFHCGEPVPDNTNWTVHIQGTEQPMCCPGCQAVAKTIIDYGLGDFYRNRDSYQGKANEIIPIALHGKFAPYDNPTMQKDFVKYIDDAQRKISLILEGVVCPACIWLNEARLHKLEGIISVDGNYTMSQLHITWDDSRLKLSEILETISSLGYAAYPYSSTSSQEVYENERKTMLKRMGIAGLFGMQVMMIAIAFYASDVDKIQIEMRSFFYWLSLLLTLPVIVYSGKPFFTAAMRDICHLRPGMDIPVALGISIAFIGSFYNTLSGYGHVYYDSVVMFIFFLLTGRYFEFMSRKRTVQHIDNLNKVIPATATIIIDQNKEDTVPVSEIKVDDILHVRPGESLPADGMVVAGVTSVDESILTGESSPQIRKTGDKVIAGSINIESPIKIKATAVGRNTVQSQICDLANEGQKQKPEITILSNKVAGWFVLTVLLIAAIVSWYWWHVDHARWLPITISVLVVTCPCALSLATPTAITAATASLMKYGIAIKTSDCIEKIVKTTDFIFDKTGTLTHGAPDLIKVDCEDYRNREKYHAIAAAMEQSSEHPLASVINRSYWGINMPECRNITNKIGYGLSAEIEGVRYFIGSVRFIAEHTEALADTDDADIEANETASLVLLATNKKVLCAFYLQDSIRPDAKDLVEYLHALHINTIMLSGDRYKAVQKIAKELGIKKIYAELDPKEKLEVVNHYGSQGAITAMIGDGINDAPVLAAAHVSIAMGGGTDLAKLNADMILLNGMLGNLIKAIDISHKTFRIIRQNISWAITYNIIALPVAVSGLLAPWMAALGMSLSSLIVIGNATRLSRQ